jgi:predicted transcriptional regulator
VKQIGKFSRLFVSSHTIDDKEKLVASYTSNETDKKLLSTIFNGNGVTNNELSNKLNMNKSLISWHLKKLLDASIIEFRQDGRYKTYHICSNARDIVVKYVNG